MDSSSEIDRDRTWPRKCGFVFLIVLLLLPGATSADEKHISVYAPVAAYTLPVVDRGGREYVGLLELLP